MAIAQTAARTTAPNAGQIEKQFTPEPQPRSTAGVLTIPAPSEAQPVPGDETRFLLRSIDLVGASAMSAAELASLYQDLIGQQVGLNELNALARRITASYRNAGYLLSQAVVPAQTIEEGKVRIAVIEGYVADFRIRGEGASEFPLVETYARKILATRPINAEVLERYLLLMNDLAGISVRGTLVPAKDQSGAATLLLDVAQQPISAGISTDNRSGKNLGPWRTTLDAQVASIFRPNDRTTLREATSMDRKLNYLALGHEQQICDEGCKIGLNVSSVRSRPAERFFIPLNQQSESDSLVLNYSYPLIRSRASNLILRASFGSYDGKTKLFDVVETEDHLRSLRIGATWDYADALNGVNLADIEYSQGIKGMGASKNGDIMLSRAQGRVDYSKLTAYLARVQNLGFRWSVLAAVSAQHAFTDLLLSELFSVGGEQFGRGFDPLELAGDHGLAGKLELRYAVPQPLPQIQSAMFYGFHDAGQVRQKTVTPGSEAKETLTSSGLGGRFQLNRTVSGFVEWAKPMNRDVAAEGNRNARIFGGVSARF